MKTNNSIIARQYVSDLQTGKKEILKKYPELVNSKFEVDGSGWTNFAVRVDGKYLFRFPRHDEAYNAIAKEYKILEILNKKLPNNIKVPNYIFSNLEGDFPYVGYELIHGTFLVKEVFEELSKEEKEKVLNSMTDFLNTLHSVDYNELGLVQLDPIEWIKDLYNRVQKVCFKYFDEGLKNKTKELFESFLSDETMHSYKPTLVHGDLTEDHILITEDGVGIIDFGDLMVFDPAYDLIWAYICARDFYEQLLDKYEGNKDNYFERRIKDFYIMRPPYDGMLYADETKNNQMIKDEVNALKQNFNK